MTTEELREALLASPKNGYSTLTDEQRAEMNAYCKRPQGRAAPLWNHSVVTEHPQHSGGPQPKGTAE